MLLIFLPKGDLPENLFFESGAACVSGNTSPKKTKKNGIQDAADKSIKSKNETIEFCVLTESCANISTALQELRKNKRRLRSAFIKDGCDGDREEAKKRIESYIDRQKDKENDLYDADSQESILEELYQFDQDIDTQKAAMEVGTKEFSRMF